MTFSDVRKVLAGTLVGCAVLVMASAPALAQDTGAAQNAAPRNTGGRADAANRQNSPNSQNSGEEPRITPNFDNADIGTVIDAVRMATHKTFIIDPRVRAQVTMRSSTPLTPAQLYEAFLSILAVHHDIAVPGAAGTIKILPDSEQRFLPGSEDLQERVNGASDEIVTQVIAVKNVSAAQLVTVLRPLVPTSGQINPVTQANMIVISDHANNVNRLMRIIARIDQPGDADVEVMPMQNASAVDVVRVLTALYQGQAQQEPGVPPLKLVADERSNSVLISGEPAARLRIKALISNLDTPQQAGGDTEVVYLQYADAEKLAPKLKEQLSGVAASTTGGASGGTTPAAQESKNAQIWADAANNALVITAPPKVKRQIKDIIAKLDIRRAEVLVEAIIVDVDMTKSSELGVNWATWEESNGQVIPGATFLTPVGGATLVDLANAISTSGANINSALQTGATLAIGRVAQSGMSFAAMLRALRSDTNSNIVATPTATTTDHQEATIKVVQEVPFVTGQYTSGSTVANGQVSPFQTIQQIEVGTILKITPQINAGDAVQLKIDIESSSVVATPSGASGITTSKRAVSTNVLIEDGGIVVLGGLISNEYDRSKNQVPFLGSIPLLGELFKDHSASQTKTNMMIFLRPQILHNATETSIETNSKYNFIREQQRQVGSSDRSSIPLLPGVKNPMLPALPPPPPPGSTPEAPITPQQKDRAAEKSLRENDAAARQAGDAAATISAAPSAPAASSAPQVQK